VKLEADSRQDTIRIKIPTGLKVDELPSPAKIDSEFGSLEATWSVKDGEIVMHEKFEIRESLAPATAYSKVKEFFELVGGAHTAPVVLVKE
jgi:hypothetical protein